MTQHDQSIGGPGAVDGIAGSPSGTEGATSGAGVDKGAPPKPPRGPEPHPAPALGGPGIMQSEPREDVEEREPGR